MGKIELQPTALMPCKNRIFVADANILRLPIVSVTAIVSFEDLKNVEGTQGIFARFRDVMVDPSHTPCCTHEAVEKARVEWERRNSSFQANDQVDSRTESPLSPTA